MPAVNFRSRLVSVPSPCKSVGYTKPPWRAVVLPRIEFAMRTRSQRMYRTYILWRARGCFLYAPSICSTYLSKRWLRAGIYFVAAHKLILNVSERTGMSVILRSNKFALQTCSPQMYTEVHLWARMSVVPRSSEFALQTCSQRMYRTYFAEQATP